MPSETRPAIIRRKYVSTQRSEHDRDDHERQHQQRVAVVRALRELVELARVRSPCLIASTARPGEVREQHGHDHRQAREQPGDDQPALVGAQEAEQSVEGGHSCMGNDYRRRLRAAATPRAGALRLSLARCPSGRRHRRAARHRRRAVRHVRTPAGGAQHARLGVLAVHALARRSSLSALSARAGAQLSRL